MNTITAKVQMFGGFSMTIGDVTVTDKSHQSKKPWSILEYLIAFRDRQIESNELIELIWGETSSVNPSGALKTLIFRTRKLLDPFGLPTQELLIQRHGSYAWNPKIRLTVDADQFDRFLAESNAPDITKDERLELLMQALNLYDGDYLPKSHGDAWVASTASHYHAQFKNAAHTALEMLTEREEWDRIITFCEKAVTIDPLDEQFHYSLIYALYNHGEQLKALEHYQETTDLFYNEYSITPSEQLKELYKLIRDKEHGITTDLFIIQESMNESDQPDGAFYCEYSVFRDFYQLNRRSIARTGDSIYLCLLTISDLGGALPKTFIVTRAMTNLNNAIVSSLRRGDAYTRYSVTQYLIMLPTASRENAEAVVHRIIRNFRSLYVRKELNVRYSIQPIAPAPEDEQE